MKNNSWWNKKKEILKIKSSNVKTNLKSQIELWNDNLIWQHPYVVRLLNSILDNYLI